MYKILLEKRAERGLDSLESAIKKRVVECLLKLKNEPRFNARKLQGAKNTWRVRAGDWRIIYEIDDRNKEIKVYAIKHRSKAY